MSKSRKNRPKKRKRINSPAVLNSSKKKGASEECPQQPPHNQEEAFRKMVQDSMSKIEIEDGVEKSAAKKRRVRKNLFPCNEAASKEPSHQLQQEKCQKLVNSATNKSYDNAVSDTLRTMLSLSQTGRITARDVKTKSLLPLQCRKVGDVIRTVKNVEKGGVIIDAIDLEMEKDESTEPVTQNVEVRDAKVQAGKPSSRNFVNVSEKPRQTHGQETVPGPACTSYKKSHKIMNKHVGVKKSDTRENVKRMSLGDMSGPLCGMPQGTTSSAQVDNAAAPAAERQNRTPIYVTGVTDTRSFLSWLRALCPSRLSAQVKGERLMLVPATAAGFRAAVTALRSLDAGRGVSFHTFSLPEDRCVRLLVKNLGRHMPEDAVREELESLGICVQGVLQLRSGRRDQTTEARPLTPHFIVSVARGPDVARVRSLTELCGSRWRRTLPRRDSCNANVTSASVTPSVTAGTHPGVLPVERLTFQGSAPPPSSSLNAAVAEETTRPATGVVIYRPRMHLMSIATIRYGP